MKRATTRTRSAVRTGESRGLSERSGPTVGRARVATALVLLVCALGAALYRIVDLQATPDERILKEVSIPLYEITVPAARGAVLDRNGRAIALSLPAATVVSDPRQIKEPEATAAALSEALGIPAEDLLSKLQGAEAFRYVVRQADAEAGERVSALDLDGIRVIAEPRREHPNGECSGLAAVGRVNIDHIGMSGIEETHNDHLVGTPGRVLKERGVRGATIPGGVQEITAAVVGGDLTLTLDRNVQYQTERLLIDAVSSAGAQSGVALVSVPSSGEILAMANASRGSNGMVDCTRHNLAATWSYEPGSVLKPVTIAAALGGGTVKAHDQLAVPSHLEIWEHRFVDTPFHGEVMWTPGEILTRSSNLGAITVALIAGEARMYGMLRAFGFGEQTDLLLKGEARGILPDVAQWNGLTLPNMAIGQGLAVTPLQMLQAYNTIANDGVLVPLKLIVDDTTEADRDRLATERILDSETASSLLQMLTDVVEQGTGRGAAVEGFSMAGKTGTAWQPCDIGYACVDENGEPNGRHYTATFAGIVGNDDGPALVVLVVIDDPKGDRYYGGQLAAPAVSEIGAYALRQLKVPALSDSAPGERRRAEPAPLPPPPVTSLVVPPADGFLVTAAHSAPEAAA